MFADDTRIPVCHSDYDDFKKASNHVLLHICEWFKANHMMLNVEKTIIIRVTPAKFSHYPLNLVYRVIQEESAILWEMIVCVILSKKVHMNMGPILNGYRDTQYPATRSQVH